MDLQKNNLTDLLTVSKIYSIPTFQRPYKWERQQWDDLFFDITRSLDKKSDHFMGAIVLYQSNQVPNQIMIIDGQQRITTVSLCLLAFAQWVKDHNSGNEFLYNKTIKQYLIGQDNFTGKENKKINLGNKNNNRKMYEKIIDQFYNSDDISSVDIASKNIFKEVKIYFYNLINSYYTEKMQGIEISEFVTSLFDAIVTNLKFIAISLDGNEDPNMIFETLNARGKTLEPSELIRNYIFMHPKIKDPDNIYEKHWEPVEKYFEDLLQEGKSKITFTDFLRYFLYANKDDNRSIRNTHIYMEMKDYIDIYLRNHEIVELINQVNEYKEYFKFIMEPTSLTRKGYSNGVILYLSINRYTNTFVQLPILMKLLDKYESGILDIKALEEGLQLIISYIIRLWLANKKFPNKIVPELIALIESDNDKEKIMYNMHKAFQRQKASPFYDNDYFKQILTEESIYTNSKKDFIRYILLLIFNKQADYKLAYKEIGILSIEHIFPQTPQKWKRDLSKEGYDECNNLLNTLGNLTLVSQKLNSSMSNDRFEVKRIELEKYSIWPYERTTYFSDSSGQWNAETIRSRASILADYIIGILPKAEWEGESNIQYNVWFKVNEEIIKGDKQKEVYINALKHMYQIADKDRWNGIFIKGVCCREKKVFTIHQKQNLIMLGELYINYHGSLIQKVERLKKIANICSINLEEIYTNTNAEDNN